jgi:hypothetical protein
MFHEVFQTDSVHIVAVTVKPETVQPKVLKDLWPQVAPSKPLDNFI